MHVRLYRCYVLSSKFPIDFVVSATRQRERESYLVAIDLNRNPRLCGGPKAGTGLINEIPEDAVCEAGLADDALDGLLVPLPTVTFIAFRVAALTCASIPIVLTCNAATATGTSIPIVLALLLAAPTQAAVKTGPCVVFVSRRSAPSAGAAVPGVLSRRLAPFTDAAVPVVLTGGPAAAADTTVPVVLPFRLAAATDATVPVVA